MLGDADGSAANVEGSATSAVTDGPRNGAIVHTNHYAREEMQPFERTGDYGGSCTRLERAAELSHGDGFTVGTCARRFPTTRTPRASICRHGDEPKTVKTVFWCVADVTAGEITYGRGNPCDSEAQVYLFERR